MQSSKTFHRKNQQQQSRQQQQQKRGRQLQQQQNKEQLETHPEQLQYDQGQNDQHLQKQQQQQQQQQQQHSPDQELETLMSSQLDMSTSHTKTITLEHVLGMTVLNRSSLTCDPGSGLVAYPAGCVVILLDAASHKQIGTLHTPRKTITATRFSSDGRYIVMGEAGLKPAVRVWEVAKMAQIAALLGHPVGITSVSFSRDLRMVVSVGDINDMTICVWSWPEKRLVALNKFADEIYSMVVSHDSQSFITVGNRHVKFFDLGYIDTRTHDGMSIQCPLPLPSKSALLDSLKDNCFCDVTIGQGVSSGYVYVTSQSGILCQVSPGRRLERWVNIHINPTHCVTADEKMVLVGGAQGTIRVFDSLSLEILLSLPRPHTLGLDISQVSPPHDFPDGSSHFLDNEDDITSESDLCDLQYPTSKAMTFDGVNLTVAYDDHSLYIWRLRKLGSRIIFTKIYSSLCHRGCVWDLTTYPVQAGEDEGIGGALPPGSLISVSSDGTLRAWDVSAKICEESMLKRNSISAECLKIVYAENPEFKTKQRTKAKLKGAGTKICNEGGFPGKQYFSVVAVCPDGLDIATGNQRGRICIYDTHTMKVKVTLHVHEGEVTALAYSSNKFHIMASGSRDRLIHVMDTTQDYDLIATLDDHSSSITAIHFTEYNKTLYLVSGSLDMSVLIRKLKPLDARSVASFRGVRAVVEKKAVTDFTIHPWSDLIAVACQDRYVRVYKLTSHSESNSFKGCPDHGGHLIKIQTDPSGQFLLTACSNKTINLLHFLTGAVLSSFSGHAENITCVQFSHNMKHVISSAVDGCIFLWKLPDSVSHMVKREMAEMGRLTKVMVLSNMWKKTPIGNRPQKQPKVVSRVLNHSHAADAIRTNQSAHSYDSCPENQSGAVVCSCSPVKVLIRPGRKLQKRLTGQQNQQQQQHPHHPHKSQQQQQQQQQQQVAWQHQKGCACASVLEKFKNEDNAKKVVTTESRLSSCNERRRIFKLEARSIKKILAMMRLVTDAMEKDLAKAEYGSGVDFRADLSRIPDSRCSSGYNRAQEGNIEFTLSASGASADLGGFPEPPVILSESLQQYWHHQDDCFCKQQQENLEHHHPSNHREQTKVHCHENEFDEHCWESKRKKMNHSGYQSKSGECQQRDSTGYDRRIDHQERTKYHQKESGNLQRHQKKKNEWHQQSDVVKRWQSLDSSPCGHGVALNWHQNKKRQELSYGQSRHQHIHQTNQEALVIHQKEEVDEQTENEITFSQEKPHAAHHEQTMPPPKDHQLQQEHKEKYKRKSEKYEKQRCSQENQNGHGEDNGKMHYSQEHEDEHVAEYGKQYYSPKYTEHEKQRYSPIHRDRHGVEHEKQRHSPKHHDGYGSQYGKQRSSQEHQDGHEDEHGKQHSSPKYTEHEKQRCSEEHQEGHEIEHGKQLSSPKYTEHEKQRCSQEHTEHGNRCRSHEHTEHDYQSCSPKYQNKHRGKHRHTIPSQEEHICVEERNQRNHQQGDCEQNQWFLKQDQVPHINELQQRCKQEQQTYQVQQVHQQQSLQKRKETCVSQDQGEDTERTDYCLTKSEITTLNNNKTIQPFVLKRKLQIEKLIKNDHKLEKSLNSAERTFTDRVRSMEISRQLDKQLEQPISKCIPHICVYERQTENKANKPALPDCCQKETSGEKQIAEIRSLQVMTDKHFPEENQSPISLKTGSTSSSDHTWKPPSDFSVQLECAKRKRSTLQQIPSLESKEHRIAFQGKQFHKNQGPGGQRVNVEDFEASPDDTAAALEEIRSSSLLDVESLYQLQIGSSQTAETKQNEVQSKHDQEQLDIKFQLPKEYLCRQEPPGDEVFAGFSHFKSSIMVESPSGQHKVEVLDFRGYRDDPHYTHQRHQPLNYEQRQRQEHQKKHKPNGQILLNKKSSPPKPMQTHVRDQTVTAELSSTETILTTVNKTKQVKSLEILNTRDEFNGIRRYLQALKRSVTSDDDFNRKFGSHEKKGKPPESRIGIFAEPIFKHQTRPEERTQQETKSAQVPNEFIIRSDGCNMNAETNLGVSMRWSVENVNLGLLHKNYECLDNFHQSPVSFSRSHLCLSEAVIKQVEEHCNDSESLGKISNRYVNTVEADKVRQDSSVSLTEKLHVNSCIKQSPRMSPKELKDDEQVESLEKIHRTPTKLRSESGSPMSRVRLFTHDEHLQETIENSAISFESLVESSKQILECTHMASRCRSPSVSHHGSELSCGKLDRIFREHADSPLRMSDFDVKVLDFVSNELSPPKSAKRRGMRLESPMHRPRSADDYNKHVHRSRKSFVSPSRSNRQRSVSEGPHTESKLKYCTSLRPKRSPPLRKTEHKCSRGVSPVRKSDSYRNVSEECAPIFGTDSHHNTEVGDGPLNVKTENQKVVKESSVLTRERCTERSNILSENVTNIPKPHCEHEIRIPSQKIDQSPIKTKHSESNYELSQSINKGVEMEKQLNKKKQDTTMSSPDVCIDTQNHDVINLDSFEKLPVHQEKSIETVGNNHEDIISNLSTYNHVKEEKYDKTTRKDCKCSAFSKGCSFRLSREEELKERMEVNQSKRDVDEHFKRGVISKHHYDISTKIIEPKSAKLRPKASKATENVSKSLVNRVVSDADEEEPLIAYDGNAALSTVVQNIEINDAGVESSQVTIERVMKRNVCSISHSEICNKTCQTCPEVKTMSSLNKKYLQQLESQENNAPERTYESESSVENLAGKAHNQMRNIRVNHPDEKHTSHLSEKPSPQQDQSDSQKKRVFEKQNYKDKEQRNTDCDHNHKSQANKRQHFAKDDLKCHNIKIVNLHDMCSNGRFTEYYEDIVKEYQDDPSERGENTVRSQQGMEKILKTSRSESKSLDILESFASEKNANKLKHSLMKSQSDQRQSVTDRKAAVNILTPPQWMRDWLNDPSLGNVKCSHEYAKSIPEIIMLRETNSQCQARTNSSYIESSGSSLSPVHPDESLEQYERLSLMLKQDASPQQCNASPQQWNNRISSQPCDKRPSPQHCNRRPSSQQDNYLLRSPSVDSARKSFFGGLESKSCVKSSYHKDFNCDLSCKLNREESTDAHASKQKDVQKMKMRTGMKGEKEI